MAGIIFGLEQKVDEKDKKIMKALFDDGRASIAKLSKKTGIRRDSVARRINRLRKERIITAFIPIINPPALGLLNVAQIMIRVKTGNDENKKKFTTMLVGNKFIVHISKLLGKFDFLFAVVYKDINQLNEIIEEIKNYVPNFIEDFEVFQVVDEPKFEKMSDLL